MSIRYNPSSFILFDDENEPKAKKKSGSKRNYNQAIRRNIKVSRDHFRLALELKLKFNCWKWDILIEKLYDIHCETNTD